MTFSTPDPPRTVTDRREAIGFATSVRRYLCLMLQAHAPLAAPRRWTLTDLDDMVLGRGPRFEVSRPTAGDARRLVLSVPDPWMSATHARLECKASRWILSDASSKNHTLVNGAVTPRLALTDGDIIQCGRSFFLYREVTLPTADEIADSDEFSPTPPAPALATLRPDLDRVFRRLALVAASEAPIILVGATGTGKEQVARAIHDLSARAGELIAVNCGALPEALVESELFGHRKGAFTGATTEQLGLVRAAHRGTLFLDEIDDLPLRAQAALLRVLQERAVVPVGTARPISADIRVIAATQRDLATLVAAGRFRADLFARLRGVEVGLPTLHARREDFGLLVAALLQRIAGDQARIVEFTTAAAEALSLYDWPLNIRELEQCLTTALALAGTRPISAAELPDRVRAAVDRVEPPLDATAEKQREDLVRLFREHSGNTGAVAQALGKSRRQVQRLVRRYRIDLRGFRS